jgi:NitT/TauT family transport system substrate-binding protein
MIRRSVVQAVVAAAGLALSGAAAPAQETVRIGLAVPHNAAYVQFYAADTLGFYKDAGVKPEITIYRGGAASQEALSAGAADIITYFGAGVGLAVSKGAKEKIVAAIDPTPHGWQFLVLANSPIKTLKDLDGQKIGVATKAGTADMFALWVADKGGAKVQTIPVGGGGMVPALRAGQVDAIAMFPGLSLQLVATGEARSLMDLGKEMEPTLPDVIVASQEMMDKRPQAVRGTLAAIYKAVAHMRNNRDWALKYLKNFTEEKDDKVNLLTYEQVVVPLSQDGVVKPEWISNSINIAAKVWGLDDLRKVKPDDIFTNAFLPSVPR